MRRPDVSPQPRWIQGWVLTAFVVAATVPALISWMDRRQRSALEMRRTRLESLLRVQNPTEELSQPSARERVANPERWEGWFKGVGDDIRLRDELLFDPEVLDQFHEQQNRRLDFAERLEAPPGLVAEVERDAVELRWLVPEALTELRSSLGEDSLLRIGFRVYRCLENEDPKLLGFNEISQSFFRDEDLPLWRERLHYRVATTLEGEVAGQKTLIDSRLSGVVSVETPENFTIELLGGDAVQARVQVAVYHSGRWIRETFEARPGEALGSPRVVDEENVDFDTGLRVVAIDVLEGSISETVQKLEFLPDGRRKVDPATGLPSHVQLKYRVAVENVRLRCQDRNGGERTFAPFGQR